MERALVKYLKTEKDYAEICLSLERLNSMSRTDLLTVVSKLSGLKGICNYWLSEDEIPNMSETTYEKFIELHTRICRSIFNVDKKALG